MAGIRVATRIVPLSRIPVRIINGPAHGACRRKAKVRGRSVVIRPQRQHQITLRALGPACPERPPGDYLGCDVWPQSGPAVFQIAAPVVPVVGRVHTDAPGVSVLVADRDVGRNAWFASGLAVDEFMRDTAGGQLDAERVKELSHCHCVVSLSWQAASS